jgi:polysaccharide export outer membrane protein
LPGGSIPVRAFFFVAAAFFGGGREEESVAIERVFAKGFPRIRVMISLAAALVLGGCATHRGAGAPNPPSEEGAAAVAAEAETVLVLAHPPQAEALPLPPILEEPYRVAANDRLTVHVLANPGLTTSARVRPDGMISVPGVGEVHAAGRQPMEIAEEVKIGLSRLVLQPEVTVMVDDFGPYLIYVLGEVQRAGSIEARREMTVLGAIAAAGGGTDRAQMNSVVLIRRLKDDEAVAVRLDLRGAMRGTDLAKDIPVRMYDIVVVPQSFVAKMEMFMKRFFGSVKEPVDLYLQGWQAFNTERVYPVRVVTVTR